MINKSITQLAENLERLEQDGSINISYKKDPKLPAFWMVSKGFYLKKIKRDTIDLLKAVAEMTSDEKFTFFTVKDNIQFDVDNNKYIYQVKLSFKGRSNTDKTKFKRGFKLLQKKGLVKRVKRSVYMISPLALVPNAKQFNEELSLWDDISKKETK